MKDQELIFQEKLSANYEDLVEKIVEEIKNLPHDEMLSGDRFLDIWEEIAFQVQIEESSCFQVYEMTVRAMCEGTVESLPEDLVRQLWQVSDARDEWHDENDDYDLDEEPEEPGIETQREGVAEELIQKVWKAAANYELPAYAVDDSPTGDGSEMVIVYGRKRLEYSDCVELIIEEIRNLPKSSMQSGEDSPLEDVWDEFAAQVQGEEGFSIDLYEELVENACSKLAEELTRSNLLTLWQESDAGSSWTDEDPEPDSDELRAYVMEELYRRVLGAASDYDLPEIEEEDEEGEEESDEEVEDAPEMGDAKEKEFKLEDEDHEAIGLAKKLIRLLLAKPDVSPRQIVGLGRALYAWERLPQVTPGVFCEFGVCYRSGDKIFSQMRYVSFLISEQDFEISMGGSVYDSAVGSDTISGPKWQVEIGGYSNREFEGEMDALEEKILKYLRLGAKITVDDQSEDMAIAEEDEEEDSEF